MSSQYRIGIPTDVLAAGSITMGQPIIPDFVFHPGPNELRLTAKGMMYLGELVEDAGAAYAALMKVMNALQGSPLREDCAVDVLQTTINQVWSEAMQVASRLVIKMTGIPLDALLAGRGVRDRMVDEGENIARALLKLRRDSISPCPASSALSIHPSVWTDPALNLLREARDTIVDFGPRGTQGEIIADIDKMLKRGVQA